MRYLMTVLLLFALSGACSAEDKPAPPADVSAASPAQADPDSAVTWLQRIEQQAAQIQTLTADLRYDSNQLLLGDEQRRFGTLHYQTGPPPRFKVHFDRKIVDGFPSRPDLYYLYDGRWLLKRDHENKTAVRYQLVADDEQPEDQMELGEGPFPLPLNLKKDKVLAKFDVGLIDPSEDDPQNCIHLQLTPREDHDTDLTRIDLWFDLESLLPVAVSSLDDSQTQTIVKLSNTVINEELPEEAFDTALPTDEGWQTDENRIAGDE